MPFFIRETGNGAWIAESAETVVFRLTFSLRDHLREDAVQFHPADELQFPFADPVLAHAAYRILQICPKRFPVRHRSFVPAKIDFFTSPDYVIFSIFSCRILTDLIFSGG